MSPKKLGETSAKCKFCDRLLIDTDIELMGKWFLELDWFQREIFEEFCQICFNKAFSKYLKKGMSLKEIHDWSSCFDDEDTAIKWKNAGFDSFEANDWHDFLEEDIGIADIEVAKRWKKAGLNAKNYGDWTVWSHDVEKITSALKVNNITADFDPVPDIEFKKLGFSLDEALFLVKNDFTADKSSYSIRFWNSGGISLQEIVSLKNSFRESKIDYIKNFCYKDDYFEGEDGFDLGLMISKTLKALKEIRLEITSENFLRYFGFTKSQILRAIDMGVNVSSARDLDFAAKMVRNGVTASGSSLVAHLIANHGIECEFAMDLAKRGLTKSKFERLRELKVDNYDFLRFARLLESLPVDEVVTWCLQFPSWSSSDEVKRWYGFGFTPERAKAWKAGGFSPDEAAAWVKSGARSIEVAMRRREAGISPKQ